MSDSAPEKKEDAGVPAWVMTFADLMTLLMCFFVLLLAFSEMDVAKFKQLSGSMKEAFGVQADVEARTIPKGTSVIAREFSPGRPDPTVLPIVRQMTVDSNENTLDALDRRNEEVEKAEEDATKLRNALKEEIINGDVAINTEGVKLVINILENASFDSGRADIKPQFIPVLEKVSQLIDDSVGQVTVSGHTDDIPISNERFRSNWDLSATRAVSVAHQLMESSSAPASRFIVSGHADTKPVAENNSAENRAKNRRVDISIVRGTGLDRNKDVSLRRIPSLKDREEESK